MILRHIISTKQFLDTSLLDKIFRLADKMESREKANTLPNYLRNKIMVAVFYEPSTRTRFSFEAAMYKLGGEVITTESAGHFSSAIKGESLTDSIKIISGYADVIVLRHPTKGSAKIAADVSEVPVINAGDGTGEHPTQALLDIYTIEKELGRLENLNIALVGDLLNGRTIHSLLILLSLYKKIKFYLVAPKKLQLPKEYKEHLKKKKITFEEVEDVQQVLDKVDVLYMTRVQKERFKTEHEYNQLKSFYVIDKAALKKLNKKAIIMHPLPRVIEITPEVDKDKRAAYFRQAKNGLYIRMALLKMIIDGLKH
ncbi:MAG: aspartate carbamoyltransferase [Nanoarchaeota archaeon]|nr:aspartate carbamoyltransferase [Nanoarchaeota archaeon]MBU1321704.1 aspartate carbamoyltransferase [Nanoarchaeota archaeon]MBU1597284.1 aspartate carbamoyltransferase [Nanoarchaeota archaeon]MBU2442248.1 aspartate carbamoyltransferase [Nanoarchaeota archaeon]